MALAMVDIALWIWPRSEPVGTVVSEAPPLIEFIPWTQEAFIERSRVRDGYLERPQAPGASTAVDPSARSRWQIPGIGGARTT